MTRATTFRTTAIIGAFLLALLMIMTVSRAAFSDPTSNDGNYVDAGDGGYTSAPEPPLVLEGTPGPGRLRRGAARQVRFSRIRAACHAAVENNNGIVF